jgi:hypothetical protein
MKSLQAIRRDVTNTDSSITMLKTMLHDLTANGSQQWFSTSEQSTDDGIYWMRMEIICDYLVMIRNQPEGSWTWSTAEQVEQKLAESMCTE